MSKYVEFEPTTHRCPDCGHFKIWESLKLKLFVCFGCHYITDEEEDLAPVDEEDSRSD